jgi:cell division topological specificity factor
VIDFFRRLFGQSGSSSTAKERLRLVLMTDHLELSPDLIESMKRDLVDVISRYVEVDRDKIDVSFEQQDKALAMLANIPILSVNRSGNGHAKAAVVAPPDAPTAPAPDAPAAPDVPATVETPPEPAAEAQPEAVSEQPATPVEGAAPADLKRRKRRRKRKLAAASDATQAAPAS